ncbi:DUF3310 domain-containing protein [Rhodococcus fascians]|nr:DUF3310 domain-containing protein [Rhodococcus fascians]MBY4237739.1 DUF3310 domain-containing protein [Rhodococcus fascians]MBY4253942.1 DUF3310 domain-containing protein [Rhodococcus fascians]MBY4269187.1 DUF3310 domain-containing protein [Rhodococcus fascians]
MSDNVNHPSHYTGFSNGAEVIDITENLNFNRGNAVKYVARAGAKDTAKTVEDLLKARWYLDRELARLGHVDAVEAIAAPVEAPVARVFNVGDHEPADKETIVLSGAGPDGAVKLKYGDYGSYRDTPKVRWWDVDARHGRPTWDEWDVWLETFGPLTEIIGTPAAEPREFKCIEDITDDVNEVRDVEGDYWQRDGLDNPWNWPSAEDGDNKYAPFTEVL